ncbi:uncharacterized protein LOC110180975 [Drosophila serrata]|uniref:uncharacterized protein LOC110180975 n=1 Tax=Drosophila serrata TaxID=7274 RepID=UPI000A1D3645|nr:uncharacterized protein LOC110180975 [Drosophila serrata]
MLLKVIYIYYGLLLPGWHTFKAVVNRRQDLTILWLKYWVIFTLLQGLGYLTDILFDGSLPYTLLKLVMAVILWLGYPDSSRIIYEFIDKPVLRNLELNLANQGFMSLGQQLHSFWSSDQEDSSEYNKGEPQVNAELLKRELSILMANISGGDTSNRESMPRQNYNHVQLPSDRQAMYKINYLNSRYQVHYSEDEQSDSLSD